MNFRFKPSLSRSRPCRHLHRERSIDQSVSHVLPRRFGGISGGLWKRKWGYFSSSRLSMLSRYVTDNDPLRETIEESRWLSQSLVHCSRRSRTLRQAERPYPWHPRRTAQPHGGSASALASAAATRPASPLVLRLRSLAHRAVAACCCRCSATGSLAGPFHEQDGGNR
jgi:hypothetical protein